MENKFHFNFCPGEPVDCEFASSLGCTERPLRKDLEKHCNDVSNLFKHFKLAVNKIEKVYN